VIFVDGLGLWRNVQVPEHKNHSGRKTSCKNQKAFMWVKAHFYGMLSETQEMLFQTAVW
jgi:hypothetical protein